MKTHRMLAMICEESYQYATFIIGECEAVIKYYDDCQVVAFRGTETGSMFSGGGWLDVLRDLRLLPWFDRHAGWCHAGFLKGGRRAAEFLVNKLDKSKPVYFTGHSLGGALSLMCAVKLHAVGYTVRWVGFGSPKCQFTKKLYPFPQTNYRFRSDIVPTMPRFTPYRHNCPVIRLNFNGLIEDTWRDHDLDFYIKELI